MSSAILEGFLLMLVGFNAVLVVIWAAKSPLVGVLTLSGFLIQGAIRLTQDPILSIGGFDIYPEYVFLLCVPALILRIPQLLTGVAKHRSKWLLLLFSAMMGVSLVRGLAEFGSGVGFEARRNVLFVVLALYFASFSYDARMLSRLKGLLSVTAAVVVLIAGVRWMQLLVQPSGWHYWMDKVTGSPFRVLVAGQAGYLGQVFVLLALAPRLERQKMTSSHRTWLYVLPFVILLLQHRSVWVAVSAAVVWLFIKNPGSYKRFVPAMYGGLVLLIVLALVLPAASSGGIFDSLTSSVAEAFGDRSSLQWRLLSWAGLMTPDHLTGMDYVIGQPMGSGFLRYVWGEAVDVQPHNYYVEAFLRTGTIGLISLLGLYFTLLRRLKPGGDRTALSALLVLQMLYFAAYGTQFEHGVFLGLAVALCQEEQAPEEMECTELEPLSA